MVGGIFERLGISVQIKDDDLILKVQTLPDGGRASAGGGVLTSGKFEVQLNLTKDEPVPTVLHEWGHIISRLTQRSSQLEPLDGNLFGKKLVQWYKDNATGQPKAGGDRGIASETYRDLPIKVPYWYAAKTTGRELESSFFEYLFLDPAKLVKGYPDFVKLVLGMMK